MVEEIKKLCDYCKNPIDSKYVWHLKLTYGCQGGFGAKELCINCAVNSYKMSIDKVRFFQELVDFRKGEKVSRSIWDTTIWSKKQVGAFATILKNKGIPIKDYGIPIYKIEIKGSWGQYREVSLHQLLGRDVVVDDSQSAVDSGVYDELEKNHDKFLRMIGVDVSKKQGEK